VRAWIGGALIAGGTPSGGDRGILLLFPHGQISIFRLKSVNAYCQIEPVRSDSDVGTACNNRAVTECSDGRRRGLLGLSNLVLWTIALWGIQG